MLPASANTNHYLRPRPSYLPSGLPVDLVSRLDKLNNHHISWWIGHVYNFAFKLNPLAKKIVEETIDKLKFKKPIVGVQVRRTDKIPEATYHPLEQYMEKVEEIFDLLELTQKIDKRRIFLASEVPEVFEEARQKFPQYEIISNTEATKVAYDVKTRYAFGSLMGMISDLHMMSYCDFMVCTLSSNICRIVLETMQTIHPDASHLIRTVDSLYFNYAENTQYAKVIHDGTAIRKQGLKVGDILEFHSWNFDGHYYLKNPKNNESITLPRMNFELVDETTEFPLYIPEV